MADPLEIQLGGAEPAPAPRPGFWAKLKRGLGMTHTELLERIGAAVSGRDVVDEHTLELVHQALERLGRHGPLHARAVQASEDLHAVERLAATVLLHHEWEHLLDALVGGVATLATLALAPSARDLTALREARVDDLVVEGAAERALHMGARS